VVVLYLFVSNFLTCYILFIKPVTRGRQKSADKQSADEIADCIQMPDSNEEDALFHHHQYHNNYQLNNLL